MPFYYMGTIYRELDPFMPSTYTTSATDYWQTWTTQAQTTITTNIWVQWSTGAYQNVGAVQTPIYQALAEERVVQTAAEIQAEAARLEGLRTEARRRNERTAAALKRAEELLLKYLDPSQQREYHNSKSFVVCAKSGTRYRINRGIMGNVIQLNDKGGPAKRLCAHVPYGEVPDPDNHLTQMMMLRHHEADFLRVANVHEVYR